MATLIKTDITPLLKNIVYAVLPFAQTKDIQLKFISSFKSGIITHQPELIGNSLFTLLYRLIGFLPVHAIVKISVLESKENVQITIENSLINLSRITEITRNISLPVCIKGDEKNKTIYQLNISKENGSENLQIPQPIIAERSQPKIPGFYAEIRKRLQAHYNTADKLVALTKIYNPSDAAFLQKVNEIIFSNIADESFDANKLSNEICLSRAQLLRKLKTIIGQSPANYIKQLRLQKAKKLLETTDKRVGEVAFETGFESVSHFTKVFTKRYGFNPSELKRKTNATN